MTGLLLLHSFDQFHHIFSTQVLFGTTKSDCIGKLMAASSLKRLLVLYLAKFNITGVPNTLVGSYKEIYWFTCWLIFLWASSSFSIALIFSFSLAELTKAHRRSNLAFISDFDLCFCLNSRSVALLSRGRRPSKKVKFIIYNLMLKCNKVKEVTMAK